MRSVRVFFRKKGNTKFISHLDLNRFMIKVIRRSGIPVWYSEGFNPHPYITFALPLSLGFESEYEVMDFRLEDDSFTNKSVYNSLKGLMPEGLDIFSCDDPIMKTGQVAFADYKIEFDTVADDFFSKLDKFLSSDTIQAQKRTKKGTYKTLELKEFIKSYSLVGSCLYLTLTAGGSNNINPKLVLDAFAELNKIENPFHSVTRTMLYNEKMAAFK